MGSRFITFSYLGTLGCKVYLCGDFLADKKIPMKDEQNNGVYRCSMPLEPGTYRYYYIVDNKRITDPHNSFGDSKYSYRKIFSTDNRTQGKKKTVPDDLSFALKKCAEYRVTGYKLAKDNISRISETLSQITRDLKAFEQGNSLQKDISATKEKISSEFREIEKKFIQLPLHLIQEINLLNENTKDFSIVLFGRTMAGKSTLMEILKNGDGSSIGKGKQRTTRDVRSYYWNNLKIVDVPGICASNGQDDETIAYEAAKLADTVLFLITDDAPQPSEAEFFEKIRALGKPVIGIMNLKKRVERETKEDLCDFVDELTQKITSDHCRKIEDQFNEFLRRYSSGPHVFFTYVHLRAKYDSMQSKDESEKRMLSKCSQFYKFEKRLITVIVNHGVTFRLKNFIDIVVKPMQDFSETLFQQSINHEKYAIKMKDKANVFKQWAIDFFKVAESSKNNFVNKLIGSIEEEIPNFVENNYEASDAGKKWEKIIKSHEIGEKIKSFFSNKQDTIKLKLNSLQAELEFETNYEIKTNNTIQMPPIIDKKKIWNWGSLIVTTGLTIAAFWWNPAGWIAAGVGIVGWLLSYCFDDISIRRENARKDMEKKLRANLDLIRKDVQSRVDKLYKDALCSFYDALMKNIDDSIAGMQILGKKQRELASSMGNQIINLNKILISSILKNSPYNSGVDKIISLGRIPGKITLLVFPSGQKPDKDFLKFLGTSLNETIRYAIFKEKTYFYLWNILGYSNGNERLLHFDKKTSFYHIKTETVTQEMLDRIHIAQQITGVAISLEK